MREIYGRDDAEALADAFVHFAHREAAPVSAVYADWAHGVAEDPALLEKLLELPGDKRQPQLLFGAARIAGVGIGAWERAVPQIHRRWSEVAGIMRRRRTQTNEAGRMAVLALALSRIPGPVALIEAGCSAGMCLYPDRWRYRYTRRGAADVVLGPAQESPAGDTAPMLDCELEGLDVPGALPEVVFRGGIDLNPLDLTDPSDREWLEALVWPGMEYRVERIARGAQLVTEEPPRIWAGDLNDRIGEALAAVPDGATPVVLHSAVLVYLPPADRSRFMEQVRASGARWISNEGAGILPEIAGRLSPEVLHGQGFVLSLDGEPLASAGPHGQYARALS